VHFVPPPVVDNQTLAPVHHGLSAMGKQLVEACNEQRVLIDLAHASMDCVEQALQISKMPLLWSHGWVDRVAGSWLDGTTHQQRRLSLAHARMIADKGGVVGLWGAALSKPGPAWATGRGSWTVGVRDTQGYAREIASLVDKLGADHVAMGTDIEGLGERWSVDDYAGVRTVLDHLQALKLPSAAIERVAFGNYARLLKAAL
jgi:membrane dipeptidase